MANPKGFHLIFICILLVATTYTCLGVGNTNAVCSKQEQLALFKFKHSVKDSYGMLSSWVGNDCCIWERIQCNGVTGNVENLHLRGDWEYVFQPKKFYLVGNEVNSSLAELRHLKYLDLSGNDFQGSRIPDFIGSFKQLSYLNLSYAGFQGIIPPHIGNLSYLKVLDLSSNYKLMTDDMSWTFRLLSLELLDLSSVDLHGAQNRDMLFYMIPSLKELHLSYCGLSNVDLDPFLNSSRILPNIKHLDLSRNSFQGPLPGFFQNFTSLTFLDLSYNNLSMSLNFANLLNLIPSLSELHLSSCGLDNSFLSSSQLNFSTLSNTQHLDLSRNSFEGLFPSVLTNMSSLKVLDLSRNMLSSSVPVMPNLLELDLSSNKFNQIEHVGIWRQCHLKQLSVAFNYFDEAMIDSPTNTSECSQYALERLDLSLSLNGKIPETLGRLTNLRGLHLMGNNLTGPIPEFLRRLKLLQVLDLSHNQLTGSIPTFLGKLSKLDLSFNQLNGSIPYSFGKLAALTYLNLEFNQLTGPIPTSLGRLVSLQEISVSSNMLQGSIPVSIGQLSKLHSLDLSNNSFDGVIFEANFANLSMLKHLDTSYNTKLVFNVSREWIPPFQLVILQMHSCNIANGFPHWLRNQRRLKELVLSNANISGPLPTWLQKMPFIPFLDLSHNNLTGPLTNLLNGISFDMFEYGVTGALYLENNLFNESIPWSLCRRTDLEYIDLSENRLIGNIPTCLWNLKKLHVIIFSSNNLSGVIPSCVALDFSPLVWLQLDDNNLTGELPQELGDFRDLRVLDLGDNKFYGNIPEWVGEKLTSLLVFRLHKNSFTGIIPGSLCRSSNLQILDVAYNNLTGTIPHCLGELNAMVHSDFLHRIAPDSNENVIQSIKGDDLTYVWIWDFVFNMDLSSNQLVGQIPVEVTALSMLIGLNLSNNHLRGSIPDNMGNMRNLESLDFSKNKLTGVIPSSMAELTFLSHLNLSNNNLSGRIPSGTQLESLNDPSIYAGNKGLCGHPLPKICTNHQVPSIMPKKKHKAADKMLKVWLYLDIMCGFVTGFCGVIGVLLFKKHWKQKLFMFAEESMEKISVAIRVGQEEEKKRSRIDPWEWM
ncbi:hypothetical protein Lser_V15G40592 [Lactuca serriola]